jgi:hypothetical protein
MKLSRQHFEFIADDIAPLLEKPTSIEVIADKLEDTNPNFNRETFTQRALRNWEDANIETLLEELYAIGENPND